MRTGENEQALKQIMDLTRVVGILILFLHCYNQGYAVFRRWGYAAPWSDRLLSNIARTGLFAPNYKAKCYALLAFAVSVMGTYARKEDKVSVRTGLLRIATGIVLYFGSAAIRNADFSGSVMVIGYLFITSLGLLLFMNGGATLAKVIGRRLDSSVFNDENETFPQEERLLENQYSVHFQTKYLLRKRIRSGWVNIQNPFRGTMIMGNPGSGKTRWIVKPMIIQQIRKQYAMVVFDYKYPDLTQIAHGAYLKYKQLYPVTPIFLEINFDHPKCRCNPLAPETLEDVSDAGEAARTILLALNPEWIKKLGDFWNEAAINLLTAVIWYLRKYQQGQYCSLPHAIELLQTPYDKLFSILRLEPQLESLVTPCINAYLNAPKMLEGMMASLTVAVGRLSSPNLYYVLSGNDHTLDIANPTSPKILCLAGNPKKVYIYGAVISLYLTAIKRLATEQQQQPLSLILEEFPAIYFSGIDRFLAVCRSYLIAVTMVVQDMSQLRLYYGRDLADVLINVVGNVIAGQATGDTAQHLSNRFGKIRQEKQSITHNSSDTSLSESKQMDAAIPAATISSLSSGEFCGIVADNPDSKIKLKKFHGEMILEREKQYSIDAPEGEAVNQSEKEIMNDCFLKIKKAVKEIVENEIARMVNTPQLSGMIVRSH